MTHNHIAKIHDLAKQSRIANNPEQAIALLRRATEIDSNDPRAWVHLSVVFKEMGRYEDAVETLEKARELKPQDSRINSILAIILNDLGRPVDAEAAMKRALSIRETAHCWNILGCIQWSLPDFEQAETAFRRALELEPDNSEALFNLGYHLKITNRSKEAEVFFQKSIEADPSDYHPYSELGFLQYRDHKNYESAEQLLRKSIELEPDYFWSHLYMTQILWAEGRLDEAEQEYVNARKICPLWNFPARLQADFYKRTGQLEKWKQMLPNASSLIDSTDDAMDTVRLKFCRIQESQNEPDQKTGGQPNPVVSKNSADGKSDQK